MSNLSQRQQLFYSPHAHWGSNFWHFPSPLYDVSPMPPSYQFPQLPSRADLVFAQRPIIYGMPFSPHYGNSYVSTPQSNTKQESRVSRKSKFSLRSTFGAIKCMPQMHLVELVCLVSRDICLMQVYLAVDTFNVIGCIPRMYYSSRYIWCHGMYTSGVLRNRYIWCHGM